jgi:hypothetical protein
MIDERLRQTGRTSRIVDFAIDQLFTVGSTIVTDHTALESSLVGYNLDPSIDNLIHRIHDRFRFYNTSPNKKLAHRKIKADNIPMVRFEVVQIVKNEQFY